MKEKLSNLGFRKSFSKNKIFQNSSLLVIDSFLNSGFGFLFWIITTNYYPISIVGLSAAIFGVTSFIAAISGCIQLSTGLGIFISTDRENDYYPKLFFSVFVFSSIFSIVMGIISIILILFLSLEMSSIFTIPFYIFLFLVIIFSFMTYQICYGYLFAMRNSMVPHVFFNLIGNVTKILIIFILAYSQSLSAVLISFSSYNVV